MIESHFNSRMALVMRFAYIRWLWTEKRTALIHGILLVVANIAKCTVEGPHGSKRIYGLLPGKLRVSKRSLGLAKHDPGILGGDEPPRNPLRLFRATDRRNGWWK